jgi:menaquinone-dependent protoporphyrinogen oxidase
VGAPKPGSLSHAPGVVVQQRPLGIEVKDVEQQPKEMAEFQETLAPRDQCIFFGVLDPSRLSFAERMMAKAVRAPMGDFRNWQAIEVWAESIARELG